MLITWMTLAGLSLIFVGGFVLAAYGSQKAALPKAEIEPGRLFPAHLVQWFRLYGALTLFAGSCCLLWAALLLARTPL